MARKKAYKPGDVVAFRLPIDTPSAVLERLTEKRGERGYIAHLLLDKLQEEIEAGHPTVTLPLPETLDERAREKLSDPTVRALLGQWIAMSLQGELAPASMLSSERAEDKSDNEVSQKDESEKLPKINPGLRNLMKSMQDDDD